MNQPMNGKTIVVTGATAGVGLATAKGVAQLGARVILVGRNGEKGKAAASHIQQVSGNTAVTFQQADLTLMHEVAQLAERLKNSLSRLDGLVLSAGVALTQHHQTIEGLESSLAVNYLHRFYLTNLLHDLLRQSAPARVVIIASAGGQSRLMKLDYAHLEGRGRWSGMKALNQAQVANDLFGVEAAQRWQADGISVNVVNPGFVDTAIRRNGIGQSLLRWPLRLLEHMAAKPADESAKVPVALVSNAAFATETGRFYGPNFKIAAPSDYVRNDAERERLWLWSEEKVKTAVLHPHPAGSLKRIIIT